MKEGFEDAFTDLQSEYISLCLEVCGPAADEIDALIYQDERTRSFNAFFVENGEVKTAEDYADPDLVHQFLKLGTADIVRLLLRHGADKDWKNSEGKTVRDLDTSAEIRALLK